MKKSFVITVCCFIVSFVLSSCSDSNTEKIMDVIIPSGTVMRPVVPSSVNIEHIVLKDQDGSIIDYLHPESIEGFEYTKGFEYVLRLKRTTIDNPPADGSRYSYSLIKILSQKNMSDSL